MRRYLVLALCLAAAGSAGSPSPGWQQLAAANLDVQLSNQQGRPVTFYRDMVQGRTTVVNFIFTNCTTVCPMLTAQFRQLKEETAKMNIHDVQLVSVSVDPERDSAAALAHFAAESKAGWTFLTGSEADVKKLLDAFHLPLTQREGHTSRFVVANGSSGLWTSVDGFSEVKEIVSLVEEARRQRGH